jgi:hypothetical protein
MTWAPWPDGQEIAPGVWAMALQTSPCKLRGTTKQITMATIVRQHLLARAVHEGRPELTPLLNSIQDSSWFIANANKHSFEAVRWPRVTQMVQTRKESPR